MADSLSSLREYRQLAPWNLRDLAALSGALLEASGIRPINAAAATRPNERTIRFYVTRGLVTAPDGKGTAATYSYRHLLQVLAIKLRQMEGATLATITGELAELAGDVLERRVAAALGAALPAPDRLPLAADETPSGRSGRALRQRLSDNGEGRGAVTWHRITIEPGLALDIQEGHPLAQGRDRGASIADAIRETVRRVTQHPESPAPRLEH